MLYTCPGCRGEVSSEAPHCPRCGHPIAARAQPPGTSAGTVATGVFGGILGCIVAPFVVLIGLIFLGLMVATCAA